jgi:Family of unknown function (DUF6153)
MTSSRAVTAIAVLLGLAAMHGITASAASAAAPCGATVAHVHAQSADVPAPPATVERPALSAPAADPGGHAGMLCLVVLVVGIALGLAAQRFRPLSAPPSPAVLTVTAPIHGRGPPTLLLSCVSRT